MEKQIISYQPTGGVCSRNIEIETEGNRIVKVLITGGCHGNTQGLSRLLVGMEIKDAIQRMEGIICNSKKTSCPDQIAQALKTLT